MKRSTVLLFSCLAIAGSSWLTHVVWGQAAESKEKTITITKSQFDKYVAEAVAAERERAAREKPAAGFPLATDEQVLKSENWHRAVFNKAEYVVYTGPGAAMFHHWVEPGKPAAPAGKHN